jgi:glycosyltransferase involved in cell wall biosynthesis
MQSVKKEEPKALKVLWITNVANPYRIPVWKAFAEEVNLTMSLLSRSEPNRAWDYSEEQIGLPTLFLGAPAFRLGESSFYWPNRKLHKLLMEDFDAVILGGWESPAYLYALCFAKIRGLKTISHYGSTNKTHRYKSGLVGRFRAWFYRNLDAHVTYGTAATKSLLSMDVKADRVVTGFNSVDHEYFHDAVNLIRANDLNYVRKGHVFLYVGQLLKRKNIDSVIRAFASMCDVYDSLRIVGSGPERQHLENLITELDLAGAVTLTGPKEGEALLEEYSLANTLVLASTNEVWGLVVNEALASGLHVVVSENCGVAADVKAMEEVYLCDTSVLGIESALIRSRLAGTCLVESPSILQQGADLSARCFRQALGTLAP